MPQQMTSQHKPSFWLSPKGFAALGLIGAVSYFMLMEHREHVWQFLPFAIFLLCPLMHLFMHGGHGRHGEQEGRKHGEPDKQTNLTTTNRSYQDGYEEGLKAAKNNSHQLEKE